MGEINVWRWRKMKISIALGDLQLQHMTVEWQGKGQF
jgi:hypothetical protein